MPWSLRTFLTVSVSIVVASLLVYWGYFHASNVVASHAFVTAGVATVGAPIEGQVVAVKVVPGQKVAAGDILLLFNDVRQRATVERARATLEEARLRVRVEREQVRAAHTRARAALGQARARMAVDSAQAREATIDAELARLQARRAGALRERDVVPEAEREAALAHSEMASVREERARGAVAMARAQLGDAVVQQADASAHEAQMELLEAAVVTAQADLRAAEEELNLTVVRAAESGTVARRLVQPGAAVRVGGPLVELWYDHQEVAVEAWVDESQYASLALGAQANVMLSGLHGEVFEGRIGSLGVVSEEELRSASFSIPVAKKLAQSRWVRVKIVLEHPDPRLLPGLTAIVSLPQSWFGAPPEVVHPRPTVEPSSHAARAIPQAAPKEPVAVSSCANKASFDDLRLAGEPPREALKEAPGDAVPPKERGDTRSATVAARKTSRRESDQGIPPNPYL